MSGNYAHFVHKMGRISVKVSFGKSNSKDVSLRTLQIFYVFGVKMWVNWLATDRNHFQAYQKYDGLETCTLQNPSIIGIYLIS